MKNSLIVLIGILFPIFSFGQKVIQQNENTQQVSSLQLVREIPKEGSYQIILSHQSSEDILTREQLLLINEKRSANKDIIWKVNESVSVRIFSYDKLSDKSFIAPPKYIRKK